MRSVMLPLVRGLVALVLTLTGLQAWAFKCDVDNNGRIDRVDITLIQQAIAARAQVRHDGIEIFDCPFDTGERQRGQAGIPAAVCLESLVVASVRRPSAAALREDDHPSAFDEIRRGRRAPPTAPK